MVNKRDVKVFIVWLSCNFGMGKLPYHRARGTRLRVSMTLLYLQWQEFALYPELSNIWCRHSFSRGMRHSTYIFSRALLIFAFTLTFNHFKMLMIGAMRAWNQWIPCIKHKLKLKHLEASYYFTHVLPLLIICLSLVSTFTFSFKKNTLWPL
jgi:hypothetical protein